MTVPPGTAYVVTAWRAKTIWFCGSLEGAVDCLTDHDCALDCEVTRVADNTMVWPLHPARRGIA